MSVTREELIYIAKLANLKIKEEEVDTYLVNLQNILEFANTVNNANVEGLKETIASLDNHNVFRKDEIVEFKNREGLLSNAPEMEQDMFKIPKVL